MEEKELEGIKSELGKLADLLEDSNEDLDGGVIAEILRDLANGDTAETIVGAYDLEVNISGL